MMFIPAILKKYNIQNKYIAFRSTCFLLTLISMFSLGALQIWNVSTSETPCLNVDIERPTNNITLISTSSFNENPDSVTEKPSINKQIKKFF